jgi:hypothetical protein
MNSSDAPRVLEQWRNDGRRDWRQLLLVRAALIDECERTIGIAEKESRGLAASERAAFDEHRATIGEINSELAAHKRAAVADVVAQGFPAEYCRLPF